MGWVRDERVPRFPLLTMGERVDPVRRKAGGLDHEPRPTFMRRWELILYGTSPGRIIQAMNTRSISRFGSETSIFLSHGSDDQQLVRAAVNFIASHGVHVFVDWIDGGLPGEESGAAALKARQAVQKNLKFIRLATEDTLSSSWAVWELGVADGAKGPANVAVLPVEHRTARFPADSCLALYPTIQKLDHSWVVVDPQLAKAEPLEVWLRS